MTKSISISLSPNTEKDDVSLAFGLLFQPWKWVKGKETKELERIFRNYFGFKNSLAFNSGRSSLISILRAMRIGRGDEVIVQAFTCSAAVNPIIYVGAKPIFVDIGENLNIDPELVKKKITGRTRAVMIQHTFGYPADVEEIAEICNERGIYLIEDCAHALGAKYDNEYCGSFGDASFFSFGRDKVISSVYGGMVVVNNDSLVKEIFEEQEETGYSSSTWALQQLLHPVLMNKLVLPLYDSKLGRGLLALMLNLNILSKAVTKPESHGKMPEYFPKRMPNGLAILAIRQFEKMQRMNEHRKMIAEIYSKKIKDIDRIKSIFKYDPKKEPIFLKYPVWTVNPDKEIREMRKKDVYLNDGWRGKPVVPPQTSLEDVCYVASSCPKAEELSKRILCLPTHINLSRDEAGMIMGYFQ